MKRWFKKLWCRLVHGRKHWHVQKYTDRSQYSMRVECWRCEQPHSPLRLVPQEHQKDIDYYRPTIDECLRPLS